MSKNFIDLLIYESECYTDLNKMEQLVENSGDLSVLPLQPTFLALKSLPIDKISSYLPRFSKEQRQAFIDLDFWQKDLVDVENFQTWLLAYEHCLDDNVKSDFVESDSLLLFLKASFNIYTFDIDDPQYPDHDYYFLTDDALLLFEYSEECSVVEEIKKLIKHLYYNLGVENAYTLLFKMVSQPFSFMEEEQYKLKKERLRDYGFVDYYESLAIDVPYPSISFMNNAIKNKEKSTGSIDQLGQSQSLHKSSLIPYLNNADDIFLELGKLKDEQRISFLQFNFIKLVNSTLTIKDALRNGSVAISSISTDTKSIINLGASYIRIKLAASFSTGDSILEIVNFTDLYKTGLTLIRDNQKKLRINLDKYDFMDKKISFLGNIWEKFINLSENEVPKVIDEKKEVNILSFSDYLRWDKQLNELLQFLPFISQFRLTFSNLIESNQVVDDYYLNYNTNEITFEILLLNSLAIFHLNEKSSQKLGLTLPEYKKFVDCFMDSKGNLKAIDELQSTVDAFLTTFSMNGLSTYLLRVFIDHLEGVDYSSLDDSEFKHVGGPVILK